LGGGGGEGWGDSGGRGGGIRGGGGEGEGVRGGGGGGEGEGGGEGGGGGGGRGPGVGGGGEEKGGKVGWEGSGEGREVGGVGGGGGGWGSGLRGLRARSENRTPVLIQVERRNPSATRAVVDEMVASAQCMAMRRFFVRWLHAREKLPEPMKCAYLLRNDVRGQTSHQPCDRINSTCSGHS